VNWLRQRLTKVRAKKAARGSFALVTVLVVALSATMGGQRYLLCRAMNEIMEPTCPCAQRAANDEQPSNRIFNDCFDVRYLDRLGSFTVGADFAVPAAPLVAVLPTPSPVSRPARVVFENSEQPIRAGPFSPAANCAQLMVFLT